MVIRDSERNLFFVLVLIVIIHVAMYNTHPMAALVRAASGSSFKFCPIFVFSLLFFGFVAEKHIAFGRNILNIIGKERTSFG